jgi:hypothetical protein
MAYQFLQDRWLPDADSYETSKEGWALYQQQNQEDMDSLKEFYPELSHWRDLERMNAWGAFCYDDNFTSWTEPYRTESFLKYLQLAQEGKLPDCSSNREAIHELLLNL